MHRTGSAIKIAWLLCLVLLLPQAVSAFVYTTRSNVNLRTGPGASHKVISTLRHNQTLERLSQDGDWVSIRTISGQIGYVYRKLVSDTWIKVLKKERRLVLMVGKKVQKEYPIGLSSFNPLGDKNRQGDGGTPEGRFYICESIRHPGQAKYGARSLRISYPNIEDARRALAAKMNNRETYYGIVKSIQAGQTPNQRTPLGGSIRIHGGGAGGDWTLGCMAMEDQHIEDLFDLVGNGVRVDIYKDQDQFDRLNAKNRLNGLILSGAKAQLKDPAIYTDAAATGGRLSYPGGDITPKEAVCTDIVIRALRRAGLDLQALVHEDIVSNPNVYRRWVKKANPDIDHRRTRNLQIWFSRYFQVLDNEIHPKNKDQFQPGDIVTMDTGISNGTIFDHIGIVTDAKDSQGYPLVINIWTTGDKTRAMDLLGDGYPTIVGHFRAPMIFDL